MGTKVFKISQLINAGDQFNQQSPDQDPKQEGSIREYENLSAGGLFDFKNTIPYVGRRIVLDLGDADDWHVYLRVEKPDDSHTKITLYEKSDFSSNQVSISDKPLFQLNGGDAILLSTSGASEELFASITATRW